MGGSRGKGERWLPPSAMQTSRGRAACPPRHAPPGTPHPPPRVTHTRVDGPVWGRGGPGDGAAAARRRKGGKRVGCWRAKSSALLRAAHHARPPRLPLAFRLVYHQADAGWGRAAGSVRGCGFGGELLRAPETAKTAGIWADGREGRPTTRRPTPIPLRRHPGSVVYTLGSMLGAVDGWLGRGWLVNWSSPFLPLRRQPGRCERPKPRGGALSGRPPPRHSPPWFFLTQPTHPNPSSSVRPSRLLDLPGRRPPGRPARPRVRVPAPHARPVPRPLATPVGRLPQGDALRVLRWQAARLEGGADAGQRGGCSRGHECEFRWPHLLLRSQARHRRLPRLHGGDSACLLVARRLGIKHHVYV